MSIDDDDDADRVSVNEVAQDVLHTSHCSDGFLEALMMERDLAQCTNWQARTQFGRATCVFLVGDDAQMPHSILMLKVRVLEDRRTQQRQLNSHSHIHKHTSCVWTR